MGQLVPTETIQSMILFIRGENVSPDRNLAKLYGVEMKQLKRAVRKNIDRFPIDLMFERKENHEIELWRWGYQLLPHYQQVSFKRIIFIWVCQFYPDKHTHL